MRDCPCARGKSAANVPNIETALCSRKKEKEREKERERGKGRETVGGIGDALCSRARHLSAGVREAFLNTRNI